MASTFYFRVTTLILVLTLAFGILPTPVQAQPTPDSPVKEHVFKFYLDPALVPDMEFAGMALSKYVADMNTILAKNTNRRLTFDPATGIVLTSVRPQTNYAYPPLPVEGFEIWAHAERTTFSISHNGYAGVDVSGAGVLAGLRWTRIYDPDTLSAVELKDYWTQMHLMLHEMAHVFGAGFGEYYNLFYIPDTTNTAPLLDISIYDPNDTFWSDKPDFMSDPLLRNPIRFEGSVQPLSRENLLAYVRFSNLTAAIISNNYRNTAPTVDLSNIGVRVVSEDGLPIEGAVVKVWSVVGTSPHPSQLMVDGVTNGNGGLSFAWGGGVKPQNSNDQLRIVKVYKDGYESAARYISIYDTDIAKIVHGNDRFELTVQLKRDPLFSDVSAGYFARQSIEKLYAAGVTGGCSTSPLLYCPGNIVTRSQMAIFLSRGMKGFDFAPAAVSLSFNDTDGHWARFWIEALAADGITGGCGNGNFCPDAPVTRAQMAIFLLRAMHGAGYTPPPASGAMFNDVPADGWGAAWVEQLSRENITSGCGGGNFCPNAPVTRAQMAVFLVKAFNMP